MKRTKQITDLMHKLGSINSELEELKQEANDRWEESKPDSMEEAQAETDKEELDDILITGIRMFDLLEEAFGDIYEDNDEEDDPNYGKIENEMNRAMKRAYNAEQPKDVQITPEELKTIIAWNAMMDRLNNR